MSSLMDVYRRLPIGFERGEGVWLWDTEGKKYLDALSGIAVNGLGHANPAVVAAIQKQAALIIHSSNIYQIPKQEELATVLTRLTGLDLAYFCNSGAEAAEAALKLSRLHGHSKKIEFPHVLVMSGAFHGRTMATIAAGGSKKAQEGFEPLVPGFVRVPYNDIEAVKKAHAENPNITAIFVEPVQGESGINIAKPGYLKGLRELCDQYDWLLMLDEIQTGMGRTGTLFAYQAEGILPDVLTVAKALGNGIPIGACLATQKVGALFKPGSHGSTFGGNPLACSAALATVGEIERNRLWENAKKQGDALLKGLKSQLSGNAHVKDIRGKGLMIGIEMDLPCREMMMTGVKHGLLFTVSNDNVIRLLPPLIFEDIHVDKVLDLLPEIINEYMKESVSKTETRMA